MADRTLPVAVNAGPIIGAQGRAAIRFSGVVINDGPDTAGDQRKLRGTNGTIADNAIVKVKADPESPEQPMPGARVAVHELDGDATVWVGRSDEQGRYFPAGLKPGKAYYVSAVDLTGQFEAVGAGPTVAAAKNWD